MKIKGILYALLVMICFGCSQKKTVYILADEAGGLKPDSEITLKDVKIGEVSFVSITPDGDVIIKTEIDPEIQIPVDSEFEATHSEDLTEKIIVQLGSKSDLLQDGDTIDNRSVIDAAIDNLFNAVKNKLEEEISNNDALDSLGSAIQDLFE